MEAGAPRHIEATVRYFTTEEGGRRTPVASGYRGQFHYEDEPDVPHDGFQFFPDVPEGKFVPLGTAVRTMIWFPQDRWDDCHRHRIRIGTRFQIQEGRKVVGRGEVTNIEVRATADGP
jgi:translation elongation factor EF-Tu-like GTPase